MTATLNTSEVTPAPAGPPRSFLLSLAAVLGVGPFAIDMYLASLPEIGADFADTKDFKVKLRQALAKIVALYPNLRVRVVDGGLELSPGPSLIPRA